MPWRGSGLAVADEIAELAWWGFVGLEVLLLLLALVFRHRVRLRTSLLVVSIIANVYFFFEVNYSIYQATITKLLTGALWPLVNLAWLVWVWRSRAQKRMAEAPQPVIPARGKDQEQAQTQTQAPAPKSAQPPKSRSATLDLRKVHEEAKAKRLADAKRVKVKKQL